MAERPVIVLGAGGHAKVVIDILLKCGRTVLAAADSKPHAAGDRLLGVPLIENEDYVFEHPADMIDLALGVGMPSRDPVAGLRSRRAIAERFMTRGYRFPPLLHPSAVIATGCTIDRGAQIMAGAVLQPMCTIGAFVIVNTGATVDHDCDIGEGSHVAPGVTLGGAVRVGAMTLIGIGSTVRQGIVIGSDVLIGAGSVAIADVPDGERQAGIPARRLNP